MNVNSSVGGLTIEDIGMKTRAFVVLLLFAAAAARSFYSFITRGCSFRR